MKDFVRGRSSTSTEFLAVSSDSGERGSQQRMSEEDIVGTVRGNSRRSGSSCETNRRKGFLRRRRRWNSTENPYRRWYRRPLGQTRTKYNRNKRASSSKLRRREGSDPRVVEGGDRMAATLVAGWKITIVTKVKENSSLNIMLPTFAGVWTLTRGRDRSIVRRTIVVCGENGGERGAERREGKRAAGQTVDGESIVACRFPG